VAIHGFAGNRQSIGAMAASSVRRSALSLLALTLLVPLDEGPADAAVSAGIRTVPHATPAARGGGTLLARTKRSKRRPAGAGAKAKPADDDAADEAADEASSNPAPKPAASEPEDDASAPKPTARKRPRLESDEGDADGDAAVSKKAANSSDEAAEASESSGGAGVTALELGFGAKALFRQLVWTSDANAAGLGPYSLTPGPETGAWLEFYPAAFGSSGFGANIGLYGSFNYGFGVSTTTAAGAEAPTAFRDFMGGLKVRFPLGTVIPNVSIGYGQQSFQISAVGNANDLPHLNYQFVRAGAGTRILVTPGVSIDVGAAYLMVLDPGSGIGQIKSSAFFPSAKSFGVDLGASVAFRLTSVIGARVGLDARLYSMSFNKQTDARPVSGAVDRYLVTYGGLEVILDGQPARASADDDSGDAEAAPKPSKRKAPKSEDEESEES
jgi:hypothetical protein